MPAAAAVAAAAGQGRDDVWRRISFFLSISTAKDRDWHLCLFAESQRACS